MQIIKVDKEVKDTLKRYRDEWGEKSINDVIEAFIEKEERIYKKYK